MVALFGDIPAETTEILRWPQRGVCLLRRRPPRHPYDQHQAGLPGSWAMGPAANARLHGASVATICSRTGSAGRARARGARSRHWRRIRRNFLVPVPRAEARLALNDELPPAQAARPGPQGDHRRGVSSGKQVLLPPPAPYDACGAPGTGEDRRWLVLGARLFRARPTAHREVQIRGYVDEGCGRGRAAARRHRAPTLLEDLIFDPLHYLPGSSRRSAPWPRPRHWRAGRPLHPRSAASPAVWARQASASTSEGAPSTGDLPVRARSSMRPATPSNIRRRSRSQ